LGCNPRIDEVIPEMNLIELYCKIVELDYLFHEMMLTRVIDVNGVIEVFPHNPSRHRDANNYDLNRGLVKLGHRRFGQLMGRWSSDGGYEAMDAVYWLVSERELDLYDLLYDWISTIGYPIVKLIPMRSTDTSRVWGFYLYSRVLVQQFEVIGGKRAIPEPCYESDEMMAGFLQGMFDGDGGWQGHDTPALTLGENTPDAFANEIHQQLTSFGISSRLTKTRRGEFQIVLRKGSIPLFLSSINFMSERKRR
jgi:hypothetical protein